MESVSLTTNSNQEMTVVRDDRQYGIRLRSYGGIVLASVSVDGVDVVNSIPCVPNGWLIPYGYLAVDCGNLRFESTSEDYPEPSGFGTAYDLVYYTHDEYVAKREEEVGR